MGSAADAISLPREIALVFLRSRHSMTRDHFPVIASSRKFDVHLHRLFEYEQPFDEVSRAILCKVAPNPNMSGSPQIKRQRCLL